MTESTAFWFTVVSIVKWPIALVLIAGIFTLRMPSRYIKLFRRLFIIGIVLAFGFARWLYLSKKFRDVVDDKAILWIRR